MPACQGKGHQNSLGKKLASKVSCEAWQSAVTMPHPFAHLGAIREGGWGCSSEPSGVLLAILMPPVRRRCLRLEGGCQALASPQGLSSPASVLPRPPCFYCVAPNNENESQWAPPVPGLPPQQ